MKRKDIMEHCPKDFEDLLKDFIDEVESRFQKVRDLLDIKDVDQLDQVSNAHRLADDYAGDLY